MTSNQPSILENIRGVIQHGLTERIEGFRNLSLEHEIYHQAYYHELSDAIREHHYGFDEFPYEYCTIRYFADELAKHLSLIQSDFQKYVEAIRKNKKYSEAGRRDLFAAAYTGLNEITELVEENNSIHQYRQILNEAIEILKGMVEKDAHKNVSLFFKYKGLDDYILERIYHMDIKGISFVDKGETKWDTFKLILTTKNVYLLPPDHRIIFQCNTRMVSYILRKMEVFFGNLYYSNIVNSKRFYSQRGNLLQGSNLNASLNRDGKPIPNQKEIDHFFARI